MVKTTIYLSDELKRGYEHWAAESGQSEAELIRTALAEGLARRERPIPTLPLVEQGLGDPEIAVNADMLLDGFGQR
ncbi:MAG: ribbon-helix-helix domain-containing protein [Nitrococcus sp.]|nr:ribbon-helix-helix domain-containing protein [Nitrococcus sp.]